MKKICKILLAMTALVIVITSLGITSTVQSTVSTAQEKAEAFTEKALPIDKSQYTVTLDGYSLSKTPNITGTEQKDFTQENVRYSLVSDKSELTVSYTIERDVLTMCIVNMKKGPVITDRPYSNLNDAIIGFLEKYQTYRSADTSEMRNMLSNTDSLKNQTLMLDNLKLKISNGDYPFSGHKTSLMWYRVINGCEYLELSLGFTDGVFTGLRDNREITPIGNTNVNVSKEQAIVIAMKYIENYTYEMPGDVWITGFNVTENRATAVLHPTERVSMLYPAWNVMLYLDHKYLGGVEALFVIVWADSGEVLLCNNQAYGGGAPSSSDNGNVVILPSPSPSLPSSPSPSASPEASVASLSSNTTTAIVAVAAIAVTVALITIFVKKRSKHHHLAFFSILLRATDLKFKL